MTPSLGYVSTQAQEGASSSLNHEIAGVSPQLIVCVTFVPDQDQDLSSLKIDGVDIPIIQRCQISNTAITVMGVVANPSVGIRTIATTFTASCKYAVAIATLNGCDGTIYFSNNGVGQQITELPITVKLQNGDAIIGAGLASSNGAVNIESWQIEAWNVLHPGGVFRTQGICSFPGFSATIIVTNRLTQPSDWAASVIGLTHQEG